ncbi:YcnI family protein [Microvirga zambiensis]|uniref:YcnI family copper-binding membrane protein n=1 Tax=Microvirga zambiensis TaxID=1402137 RepID=UPI00191EBB97|nr:YcnI family protein [Microvirga zambiensis]
MKNRKFSLQTLLATAVLIVPFCAQAHVSFDNKEVKAGSTVKFVLVVPHGCAGSPTIALKVALPPELAEIKPQPKPGWLLTSKVEEKRVAAAGAEIDAHGGHGAEIREITWSESKLEDAHFDEFVFRAKVRGSVTVSEIFVPVVQQCESGTQRWIEVPQSGRTADELKYPAPSVKVRPGP